MIVADEEMARRSWIVGDSVVFGPDNAAEETDDGSLRIKVSDSTPGVVYLDSKGCPVSMHVSHEPKEAAVPELGSWQLAICAETESDTATEAASGAALGRVPLKQPCSHEQFGVVQGYVWYSAELDWEEDAVEQLLFANTPNRVSVFVNGQYCGTHAERRLHVGLRTSI